MRFAVLLCAVLAICTLGARSAHAHPPPFWWMTDMSDRSHAGFELLVGNPDLGIIDTTALVGGVYGHFVASPRISIDVRLPLAFVYFDDPGILGENSEAAIGNFSLGMHGTVRRRTGVRSATLYGGGFTIYVPTTSDEGAAIFAVAAAGQLAIPDRSRWLIDTTTARLSGDLRFESGALFFQGELNLDLHFADGDDEVDVVLGLGPGVKIDERLALLLELTIADLDGNDQLTVDFGVRYHTHTILAGFRIYVPLSDPARDNNVIGAGFDIAGRF